MSDLQKQFPGLSRINNSGSLTAAQAVNMAMDEEHWITLSGKDKDGGKHGGARVKIDDSGKIVGGAGGKLNGRVLSSAKSKSMTLKPSGGSSEVTKTGGGTATMPDTSRINSSGSISAAQSENAWYKKEGLSSPVTQRAIELANTTSLKNLQDSLQRKRNHPENWRPKGWQEEHAALEQAIDMRREMESSPEFKKSQQLKKNDAYQKNHGYGKYANKKPVSRKSPQDIELENRSARNERTGAMTDKELEAYFADKPLHERESAFNGMRLYVPYEDREKAKSAGARWDSAKKTWRWPGLEKNKVTGLWEWPSGEKLPESLSMYTAEPKKKETKAIVQYPKAEKTYTPEEKSTIQKGIDRMNNDPAVRAYYEENPWYESNFASENEYVLWMEKSGKASRVGIGMYR